MFTLFILRIEGLALSDEGSLEGLRSPVQFCSPRRPALLRGGFFFSAASAAPPPSATSLLPPLPHVSCKLSTVNLPFLSPFPATLTGNRCKASKSAPVSPFLATLTDTSQLVENKGVLSPVFATLTRYVTRKSFACHSYRKHLGVGESPFVARCSRAREFPVRLVPGLACL